MDIAKIICRHEERVRKRRESVLARVVDPLVEIQYASSRRERKRARLRRRSRGGRSAGARSWPEERGGLVAVSAGHTPEAAREQLI
eukprot:3463286-Pleurochrysis_carterae.AAC.1